MIGVTYPPDDPLDALAVALEEEMIEELLAEAIAARDSAEHAGAHRVARPPSDLARVAKSAKFRRSL